MLTPSARAVAVETAVMSPEFVTESSPAPASTPVAIDFALDFASADAEPSTASAPDPPPLTAVETAVTAPSLVIVSLPLEIAYS